MTTFEVGGLVYTRCCFVANQHLCIATQQCEGTELDPAVFKQFVQLNNIVTSIQHNARVIHATDSLV